MSIAFGLLFLLYAGLAFFYLLATDGKTKKISPWPLLSARKTDGPVVPSPCRSHDDCPSTHVCLGDGGVGVVEDRCVRKLVANGDCDSDTGQWTSYHYRGTPFAVCTCSKPHLVDQKFFGGNCDVDVGCGIHGFYDRNKNACDCDRGYRAVGLTCQKLPAVHALREEYYDDNNSCLPDEIAVGEAAVSFGGFHKDYLKILLSSSLKCVRKPCSFDALSGRYIGVHGRFVEDWGCVCDPRYGFFGVVLEGNEDVKYLTTPGFDACASAFVREPADPMQVTLQTFFYLGKRDPVSLVRFDQFDERNLIPAFRDRKKKKNAALRATPLVVSQKRWRYDYAQYFFKTVKEFRARTREIRLLSLFHIEQVDEWCYRNSFVPERCAQVPNLWMKRFWHSSKSSATSPRVDAYELLYASPVCRVDEGDPKADPMFWDRVVVNPQQITYSDHAILHRSNAFFLQYDPHPGIRRWTLDLDFDVDVSVYVSDKDLTNVPTYPFQNNNEKEKQSFRFFMKAEL